MDPVPLLWRHGDNLLIVANILRTEPSRLLSSDSSSASSSSSSLPLPAAEAISESIHHSKALRLSEFYYLFVYIRDNQPLLHDAINRLNKLQHPTPSTPPPPPQQDETPMHPVMDAPIDDLKEAHHSSNKYEEKDAAIDAVHAVSAVDALDAIDHDDTRVCSICMDSTVDIALPCLHAFCNTCLNDWHTVYSADDHACPLCRASHTDNVLSMTDEIWILDAGNEKTLQEQIYAVNKFVHLYLDGKRDYPITPKQRPTGQVNV